MDVFNVAFNRSLIESFSNTNLRVCIRETLKFNSELDLWFFGGGGVHTCPWV